MTYFILGSHPKLSIAEIQTVFGDSKEISRSLSVLLLDDTNENLIQMQERLAGTIKVGQIIGEMKKFDEQEAVELIASYASGAMGKNKISFGISIYDLGNPKLTKDLEHELKNIGGGVKKILKEIGRPVRYVSSKEPRLSSVIVEQNGVLSSGGEYVLLCAENKILIGQTEAVQDFKNWSARDYGRPARDKKSGMLPPKLARMMINLAGDVRGKTLLDPFCGSGTILMEAALMGAGELIASDISEKATTNTVTNLTWLVDAFDMQPPKLSVHTSDAKDLGELITTPVDMIIGETFLGNPRHKAIAKAETQKTTRDLMAAYEPSLVTLYKLLANDGRAVIAFPAFVLQNGSIHHLPLKPLLEKIGFTIVGNYLYKRDKQFVARDIFVLSKTQ